LNSLLREGVERFWIEEGMKLLVMKKPLITAIIGALGLAHLTGCIGLSIGGGSKTQAQTATVGQQLIDLQKAKQAGVITEAEYQSQKAKLLSQN
jgi:hypothetical protein